MLPGFLPECSGRLSRHPVPPRVQWEDGPRIPDYLALDTQSPSKKECGDRVGRCERLPGVQWEVEQPEERTISVVCQKRNGFLLHFTGNISFVCQTTAVSPLLFVFTVWPYCSRVNIKDPDGYNT